MDLGDKRLNKWLVKVVQQLLAPGQIRTYSLARWRFCRQHRVAAMESGAADVDRAPRGALWNPMTMMMKLLMLGAAAA